MGQYQHVRTGILLVYIALWLTVLAVLMVPLALLTGVVVLVLAAPLLVIAASLMGMIGRIMCLSVPEKVGASGLIYGAVACDVVSLAAAVSNHLPGVPNFSAFSSLLGVIGAVLFVLFLKKLAVYIGAKESAVRAGNLINVSIGLVVAMVLGLFLPPLALVALVLALMGFIFYARLLSGLKQNLVSA